MLVNNEIKALTLDDSAFIKDINLFLPFERNFTEGKLVTKGFFIY